jgi:hypothetical protein
MCQSCATVIHWKLPQRYNHQKFPTDKNVGAQRVQLSQAADLIRITLGKVIFQVRGEGSSEIWDMVEIPSILGMLPICYVYKSLQIHKWLYNAIHIYIYIHTCEKV